jgi:hypothetical protein
VKNFLIRLILLSGILLGLPMLGVILAGLPVQRYLEFPPETQYIDHAPFSWIAFTGYSLFILAAILPIFIKILRKKKKVDSKPTFYPFPWWGWIGLSTGLTAWVLAWTRFPWFAGFQPHTFTPLWFSFILVINALTYKRTGNCMIINRPKYFIALFPVSAVFWWFFEYLNRFVQNWQYIGLHFSSLEYLFYATISFSTVLPAVLGTREWIQSFSWVEKCNHLIPFGIFQSKPIAIFLFIVSSAGLVGISIWPDYLFPLLWISPLLVIVSLQIMAGENHIISDIARGDWRLVISSALAALFCGFFWEMWNDFSLAKWIYNVPFVQRFQGFEMPVLGYAGYLPFGLECSLIGKILARISHEQLIK